jgi:predicted nucleic acid-binding protein
VAKTFVDTNILFYTLDHQDPEKTEIARKAVRTLLASNDATISSQVANELASNIIRRLRKTPSEALGLCRGLKRFSYVTTSLDSLERALLLMQTASISFWDAAIVASASEAGCSVLLTEDLNHGQNIAGVLIRNPFHKLVGQVGAERME